MPIDYKKYPPDWDETRKRILARANNCCEVCGVKNYSIGYRDEDGEFIEVENSMELEDPHYPHKLIKIILTIAHLDHDEYNWDVKDERLKALCQKHHLGLDVNEKKKRMKSKKAIGDFFAL